MSDQSEPRFFDSVSIFLLVIGLVISGGLWWWTRSWLVGVAPFAFFIGLAWGEPLLYRRRRRDDVWSQSERDMGAGNYPWWEH